MSAASSMPAPTASPCSQRRVVGGALDGMAEGVAEIEQRAVALLAFVARDDVGLDLARALDGMRQRGGIARQQLRGVRFQPVEELAVDDEPVLDDLGEAGAQLAIGQGAERVGIGEHRGGLMKRADEILAARVVDAGLAADRRIHLREQRGRDLHEGDAALVTGGGEAGHVADHAAAERDDAGIAREAVGDRARRASARRLPASCATSPSGSATSMQRRGASAAVSLAAYSGPTVVLVTSRTSRAGMARVKFVLELHRAGADEDRIAAGSKFYFDSLHARSRSAGLDGRRKRSICGLRPCSCAALNAAKIESATTCTLRPSVAMVKSASDS